MSHSRTSPSPQPPSTQFSRTGFRARQYTASSCVSAAMKGLANTRSNFAALTALVYSRARSKGCSVGSRFRCTCITSSLRSRVTADSVRFITLTFIFRDYNVQILSPPIAASIHLMRHIRSSAVRELNETGGMEVILCRSKRIF